MCRLIKAELFKLKKSKVFKVLFIITLLMTAIIISMISLMTEDNFKASLGDMPEEQKTQMVEKVNESSRNSSIVVPGQLGIHISGAKDSFNLKPLEVFHVSFGTGVLEVLIGVLVASMFAKEYSQGTIKNTLAYGKERWKYYIAKFIGINIGVILLVTMLVAIPTIVVTILRGWGQTFEISQIFEMLRTLGGVIVVNASIVAILMLIASIVKSSGATIGSTILLFIALPTLLGFLYGRYDFFDKIYELTTYYNSALVTSINATGTQIFYGTLIGCVTMLIALSCGILTFKSQDIK